MKDLIDEKNKQEKMKRSIIKFWNVSYGKPEAIGGEESEREHTDSVYADTLYDEADAQGEKQTDAMSEDEVSQTKIQQILREKDDRLQSLIEQEQKELS